MPAGHCPGFTHPRVFNFKTVFFTIPCGLAKQYCNVVKSLNSLTVLLIFIEGRTLKKFTNSIRETVYLPSKFVVFCSAFRETVSTI